jgi:hypothetical protein
MLPLGILGTALVGVAARHRWRSPILSLVVIVATLWIQCRNDLVKLLSDLRWSHQARFLSPPESGLAGRTAGPTLAGGHVGSPFVKWPISKDR